MKLKQNRIDISECNSPVEMSGFASNRNVMVDWGSIIGKGPICDIKNNKVILRVLHQELTVTEAADSLGMSERQLYRILKRCRTEGEVGLCHRLRGRKSNKAFAGDLPANGDAVADPSLTLGR